MRIGAPARRHDVPDEDIRHAAPNGVHKIDLDDELTVLIGPDTGGRMLEVGVLDLDGDDPVVIHAMPLWRKFAVFLSAGR